MPAGSGTNPIDKKKKTEEDKPEEQRDKEKKKRNNPKSETDKDEKDRNPHDPDSKKLRITGLSMYDEEEGKTFTSKDPGILAVKSTQLQFENIFGVKINQQNKQTDTSVEEIYKKVNKQIISNQNKINKKKEKEEKKKNIGKAIGKTIQAVGENISQGYSLGQNILRSR